MVINPKKTPYQGLWIFLPVMILPSVFITWLLYLVIAKWQPFYGVELNLATAKIFGCGCGIMFHVSCWLMGVFTDDYRAMKTRLKELPYNLDVSLEFGLTCYLEDVKSLGLAYWIDVAVITANAWVFVDAVLDYLTLRGFL